LHLIRRSQVFRDSADIAAERLLVDRPQRAHGHDFLELVLVSSGSGRHDSGRGGRDLRRGSVVIVRPGDWHGYGRSEALDVTNIYVTSEVVAGELLHRTPQILRLLSGGAAPFELAGPAFADAERLGRAIAHCRPGANAATRRRGLLLCLLAELADGQPAASDGAAAVDDTIAEAAAAMAADPAADWSVAGLAASAHVSPGHFARAFRRQLGSAPMTWLAALRGERAAALLIETDLPVAEVGRLVGWTDPNYASRRFRHLYGVAPAVYRRRFGR
jgi:AraC family L-rhamnose operon transcriptional activator RhaR